MSKTHEQVKGVVYRAVDEINAELADGQRLAKDPATVLFGSQATIDSMTLVSFIVAVEEQIHREFGASVVLVNDKAMSRERSPFRTLGSLIEYVEETLAS